MIVQNVLVGEELGVFTKIEKDYGEEIMTEKRFTISIDSNDRKSLWDDERTEEEPLIALDRFGEIWGIDDCCKLLNSLNDENEQLKWENNELKCALALDAVDYIVADGKKIDIPPYYEFEQRYNSEMHRREYDGYD